MKPHTVDTYKVNLFTAYDERTPNYLSSSDMWFRNIRTQEVLFIIFILSWPLQSL